MAKPLTLIINGVPYDDYKRGSIMHSMDSLAKSFTFDFANVWTPNRLRVPFKEGDPVQIKLGNTLFVDGFIDAVPVNYDAQSNEFQVIGRSWAGHLVDCSAIYATGCWSNSTLKTIIETLIAPYGMVVRVDPWAAADIVKPFPRFAINDEETVYECMSRAAKARGVFLMSDAGRTVIITKRSPIVTTDNLTLGGNIHSARRSGDFQARFSQYFVKSQRTGTDIASGPIVEAGIGQALDPQVQAYRPLVIFAESQADPADCTLRAQWERNVRAGKSRRVTYTVKGSLVQRGLATNPLTEQGIGLPWSPNTLVPVDDYVSNIQQNLLITTVVTSIGHDESQTVQIEVTRPEAYDSLLSPSPQSPLPGGWLT